MIKAVQAVYFALLCVLLLGFADSRAHGLEPFVNRIVIDGTINPAVAEFVHDSIRAAAEGKARALLIELDSSGGLLNSARDIVKDILGSPVPVIVYVAQSGAGAASPGTFITLARTWRRWRPAPTSARRIPRAWAGRMPATSADLR